jgi:hypothetical protein
MMKGTVFMNFRSKMIGNIGFLALLLQQGALIAQTLHQSCVGYGHLGNKIISSHGAIQKPQELSDEEDAQIKFDVPNFTDQEKRVIAYGILDRYESRQPATVPDDAEKHQAVRKVQPLLFHDLELFESQDDKNKSKSIFAVINNTTTIFGEAALAKMLVSPSTNINRLRARQAFLKELIANEELFKQVEMLMLELKEAEPALYSFWSKGTKATQERVKSLYPESRIFQGLKGGTVGLELYTRLGNLGTAWSCVGDIALMALMLRSAQKNVVNDLKRRGLTKENIGRMADAGLLGPDEKLLADKFLNENVSFFSAFKQCLHFYWPIGNIKKIAALNDPKTTSTTLYTFPVKVKNSVQREELKKIFGVAAVGQAVFAGLKAYNVHTALKAAALDRDAALALQERLIGVASFVRGLKKVEQLAQNNLTLREGLAGLEQMKAVLRGSFIKSKEFNELLTALQTNTFKGEASFFSLTGRVLSAYLKMQAQKEEIATMLEQLGELDAYLSMAKLYKKFSHHDRIAISFAEFISGSLVPYVKLVDFWPLQVDPAQAVTNSLELGAAGGERDIVLTGSNTGGKSTILKAIMFNLLLAQTFGIAAAKGVTLTPFGYLGSSMNIVDNAAAGKSLYQAEVDRTVAIYSAAREAHENNELAFLCIDELFRGTSAEKADKETAECARKFINLSNSSFILATHYFTNPPRLEAETNGVCKNYKVESYLVDGKIVRPFKIESGISTSNIAADILQQGFGNSK